MGPVRQANLRDPVGYKANLTKLADRQNRFLHLGWQPHEGSVEREAVAVIRKGEGRMRAIRLSGFVRGVRKEFPTLLDSPKGKYCVRYRFPGIDCYLSPCPYNLRT